MSVTHVAGVDPGLVHTGAVRLEFFPEEKAIEIGHQAISGAKPEDHARAAEQWIFSDIDRPRPHIFIEKYQPRGHLNSDAKMAATVHEIKAALPSATVLLNTGVKKVVRRPLMELLGVWSFTTVTHHQDLRSAARIAVLGMLKSDVHNRLLADVVRDHLKGATWDVRPQQ